MSRFSKLRICIYHNFPKFSDRQVWTNSVDPNQTAPERSCLIWVYTVCLSVSIFWLHLKILCHFVRILVITSNFSGIRIFKIFTVLYSKSLSYSDSYSQTLKPTAIFRVLEYLGFLPYNYNLCHFHTEASVQSITQCGIEEGNWPHQYLLLYFSHNMSLVSRKSVFWVCYQARLKLACAATEARQRLEISDIETRGIILSRQWTTKALIRLNGWFKWVATQQNQHNHLCPKHRLRSAWHPPRLIRVFIVH